MAINKIGYINQRLQFFLLLFIVLLSIPFGYYAMNLGKSGLLNNNFSATSLSLNHNGNFLTGSGIAMHMLLGALLTLLSPIQVILGWRKQWMKLHKGIGYLLFGAAILTGIGGLLYVLLHGTTGGIVMDIGFGLYGILMIYTALQTVKYARNHQLKLHEEWSLRLFVLGIASWFYRICYGTWFFVHRAAVGHTENFQGSFDYFMDFAFYLPPLLVLEFYFRKIKREQLSLHPLIVTFFILFSSTFITIGFIAFWGSMFA